jgi:DNA mismatch repair protein MSH6
MGGKSTLLRCVCLATMLAHAGGWVPASCFECTAVDAVFTRMGARDAILSGQSTFLVELAETAAALTRAGPRALVALDELGRGTATADGAAIAGAVLDHLARSVRCRGLFATHYHRLADEAGGGGGDGAACVGVCHMAADVRPDPAGGSAPVVTFLYKLTAGACPASHGTNVARLAGMPPTVVDRAAAFAGRLAAGDTFDGAVTGAGAAVAGAAALARRLKAAVVAGDAVGVAAARAAAARLAALVGKVPAA